MAGLVWPLLGVLAGAALAVQVTVNAELARGLGLPVAAAAVSFFAGAVILAVVTLAVARTQDITIDFGAPSPWLFVVGGLLGATYVTSSIILVPRIGAAALLAFIVAGQLVAGLLIDRIGYLGVAVRELSAGRIAGALLLMVGAVLIRFS
ncbi:MAG: DMT family transporter [Rhizobiaceae bacterium]